MEPKALPPSKINPVKLLPSSGVSAIAKKISFKSLVSEDKSISSTNLGIIKTQVIKINDLIKTNTLLKKAEETRKRKLAEQKKFSEKEEKLEAKPETEDDKKIKLPGVPKLSFLDRIKKFLFNILLGFIVVRLLPQLPKLIGVVKLAGQALDFVTDWGGKLLNGLVTFIDWGYKAYDNTKLFLKNLGGDTTVKVFDGFIDAIDKVIESSIIAMIAFGELGRDGGEPDVSKRGKGIFGRGLSRSGTRLGLKFLGRGGVKAALRLAKPLLGRIPIIGGLLEFGLSWALGDSISKSLFRGIGALLIGAVGTAIGGPIGAAIGGVVGGEVAGRLYDMFFENKTPTSKKVQGRAQGGVITRGGRPTGFSAKRQVKKSKVKREVSITPSELKPGVDIGGEKKIEKIFPRSSKSDTINPLGYTEDFYDKTGKIPFFGPIFSIATKALLGDKPSSLDYENIGKGLNSWMGNTFSNEVLRTGGAFAGGGEVNTQMFMMGEDLSKIISKSVEETVSSRIDNIFGDLNKQLALKQQVIVPDKSDPTLEVPGEDGIDGGGMTKGQWGPLLDLIAGKESGGNYESMYPSTTLPGATKMTISEVARRATGAVGKYQQLPQYLVGRARAAGLNPDKDLYSPENQEKIIINVNIKGRGGERWLKGEISDEEFMQGLSQEFASLPNAQGKFYYPGQRSSMTPAKIKLALSKVKRGGYSQEELSRGSGTGIELGRGYGSAGSKIAGELGRFIKQKLKSPAQFQAVTEHPEHGGVRGGHASGSYHYSNRAIDIGAYTHEQGPILNVISQFNKMKGVKPVELLHGRNDAGHTDHIHVAYGRGGLVRGFTRAILGERGIEFVLDTDTTTALEQNFPGFLDALNKANYEDAIQVLRDYASYERGYPMEVVVEQLEPEVVMVPMPTSQQSVISSSIESRSDSWRDYSYMQG